MNLNSIFFLLGISVYFIFWIKIEWLSNIRSFRIICFYSIILFIMSYLLVHNEVADIENAALLRMPLVSTVIFYIMHKVFFYFTKRDPVMVYIGNSTKAPKADVIFSMIYIVLGILVPIIMFM